MDPVTGKQRYTPQTGRGPQYARHGADEGVGEYLYKLQEEKVCVWGGVRG